MNDIHENYGKVRRCSLCARNQNPKKRCPIWEKWGEPERMLNCWRWADRSKA